MLKEEFIEIEKEEEEKPSPENFAPSSSYILFPYRPNGEYIFSDEPAQEGTFVFKDIMMDPEGDNVKLQMELRLLNESFTGIPNYESKWVKGYNEFPLETPPGDCVWNPDYQEYVASISVYLTEGKYHWQLRAIDEHGAASSWSSFDNLNPPIYLIVQKEEEFTESGKKEWEQRLPEEHLIEDAAFVYQLEDALEFSQDTLSQWLLLAPASAGFPDIEDPKVNVTKLDDNVYLVEAYVDSQNTSGAMVRSYYSVKVTVTITDEVIAEISFYDFEFSDYSILRDEYT